MKLLCFTTLAITFVQSSKGQRYKELPLQYYYSSEDFTIGKISEELVYGRDVIKDRNTLIVPKIMRSDKVRTSKNGNMAWAINYQDTNYINLEYSRYLSGNNLFAQMDVVGRYCLVFVDKESPKRLKRAVKDQMVYATMGLAGMLFDEITTGHIVNTWKDKDGIRRSIIFSDTANPDMTTIFEVTNSTSEVLTSVHLRKILNDQYTHRQIAKFSFDKVVDILIRENEKDKKR